MKYQILMLHWVAKEKGQNKHYQLSPQIECPQMYHLLEIQPLKGSWDFTAVANAPHSVFPVLLLQQVFVKKKKTKKRESNVMASQSEGNHWPSTVVIGLIAAHQMQAVEAHLYDPLRGNTLCPFQFLSSDNRGRRQSSCSLYQTHVIEMLIIRL